MNDLNERKILNASGSVGLEIKNFLSIIVGALKITFFTTFFLYFKYFNSANNFFF